MLMKRIGKMRQKKGAVLFAVIAVMTLLIAMASTAYYTARSAYNSVVSNYDYSQLYMSATSVADMVVEAMASEPAKSAAGVGKNNFEPLRDAVFGTDGLGVTESGLKTPGEKIVARTGEISAASAGLTGTARDNAVLDELAAQESAKAGSLDGVIVEIELSNKTVNPSKSKVNPIDTNGDGTPETIEEESVFDYTYVYRTIAYYRNNSITVEDIVKFEKTFFKEHTPGTKGYQEWVPYLDEEPDTAHKSGTINLNTFFTSTGHIKNNDTNEIEYLGRDVIVNTHEITDDVYYQNDNTFFYKGTSGNANDNTITAGVTSFGSVYFDHSKINVTEDDNDWYIGKNLVLTNDDAGSVALGDNNNLYVGGDLVISNQKGVTAKDVFVMGDLYILNQCTIDANLHVQGNIYYELPADHEVQNKVTEKGLRPLTTYTSTNEWTVTGNLEVNGKHVNNSYVDDSGNTVEIKHKITVGTHGSSEYGTGVMSDNAAVEQYDPKADANMVTYTNRVVDETADKYITVESDPMTAKEALEDKVGSGDEEGNGDNRQEYANYTAAEAEGGGKDAYDTTMTVDFSKLDSSCEIKGGADGKQVVGYYYKDPATGVTIKSDKDKNKVEVSIPYVESGYVLDIPETGFNNLFGNFDITYNIDAGSDPTASVPIILKDNIKVTDNSSQYSSDSGVSAFSWQGHKVDSNDTSAKVVVSKATLTNNETATTATASNGNIVFEMANLDKNGNIVPYDEDADQSVVRYISGAKEFVGTLKQAEAIVGVGEVCQPDASKAMGLLDENSCLPADYANQVMIVSNANNKLAYDGTRQNSLFCGIVYAPNGEFRNTPINEDGTEGNQGGTNPIMGGLIVSTYSAKLSPLIYAEPQPSRVKAMLGSLYSEDGNGTVIITPGEITEHWEKGAYTPGTESSDSTEIRNGSSPILVGSNYVG